MVPPLPTWVTTGMAIVDEETGFVVGGSFSLVALLSPIWME